MFSFRAARQILYDITDLWKLRKEYKEMGGAGGAREGLGLRGAATVRGAEKRQRRTAQPRQ